MISPLHLAQEQFLSRDDRGHGRKLRWSELLWCLPAVVAAFTVVHCGTRMTTASGLLTATSILTGLTFSMTTTFWSRSVDARRDPNYATNGPVLNTLDRSRDHLMWTVFVGVVAAGALAMTSIFAGGTKGAPVPVTALCAALVIYLVTLVGVALQRFAEAALTLR